MWSLEINETNKEGNKELFRKSFYIVLVSLKKKKHAHTHTRMNHHNIRFLKKYRNKLF